MIMSDGIGYSIAATSSTSICAYGFYPDEDTTQHKKGESEMKDQQTDANMKDDVGPERPKGTPVKVLHIGRDRLPLP